MKENCQHISEQISRMLMGDLEPHQQRELEGHLQGCPDCSRECVRLEETLRKLGSLEEVPVPHHFFVEPAPESIGPWQLFKRLSILWKGAFSSAALGLLLLGAFSLGGVKVRAQEGVVTLSFGGAATDSPARLDERQLAALTSGILDAVDQRIAGHNQALSAAFRREVAEIKSEFGTQQRELLGDTLDSFQRSMEARWMRQSSGLQEGVRRFVLSSYDRMQKQYRSELKDVALALNGVRVRGDLQDRQMQLLSNAVLEIADGPRGNQQLQRSRDQ